MKRSIGVATLSLGLLSSGCVADVTELVNGCDEGKLATQTSAAVGSVKAFLGASRALATASKAVEGRFRDSCNAMNTELGLPVGKNAAEACGTLKKRVDEARAKGAGVTVSFSGGCTIDASLEADCYGKCSVSGSCDVAAKCEPGKLEGSCSAECTGQCEVTAPTLACEGSCAGECELTAAAACAGSCSGSCDAAWSGTCEGGCTAGFEGQCGGTCDGMCDGTAASGTTCKGKCVGKCTGKANGKCTATCTGKLEGSCKGSCTGSCTISAGAKCAGRCKGSCTYTPGTAKCEGTCRGGCKVWAKPPHCEGKVSCDVDAQCQASCRAKASATVDCSAASAQIAITGDLALFEAVKKHGPAFAAAAQSTLELYQPAIDLANKTVAVFEALGDLGGNALACVVSAVSIAADVKVSVEVSVSASATFGGGT